MAEPIDDPNAVQQTLLDDIDEDDVAGETIELDDDASDVEEVEGGALVTLDDGAKAAVDAEHAEWFRNLADELDGAVLDKLASDLLELIDEDKEARKKRDEQYEEGIRRTGMGDDAPGGAQFAGATRVVHPLLAEAAVDFSSRAMKELWPAGGPAKDFIPGTPTKAKFEKAQRKAKHMNYQLTVQCRTLRSDLEQLMTQVPLGGAQYLHVDWNTKRKVPKFTPIYIDEMLLPYNATNYYGAERRTHMQTVTRTQFETRVEDGLYRDLELSLTAATPDETKAQTANDKVEGKDQSSTNPDDARIIFRSSLQSWRIDGDAEANDEPAPYIVHLDEQSRKVLGVYRNWMQDDKSATELADTVEFPFIPWRGAYPIGLTHLIGGISAALTGALRAFLDSALINNFPGALKLKGSTTGQSTSINATQLTEIEGSIIQDDIRKLIMPLPFNPPSQALFALIGFLTEAGKGVVQTSFDKLSEQNSTQPVGTTVALIDQGLVVYSAIHARLHDSMSRLLDIVNRLNGLYLDEEELKDEVGEVLAYRRDYEGPLDVVPVSDPQISSEVQRFAKVQAVVQRADIKVDLYNPIEVETMWLEQLKIPDYERLLVKQADPKPMNAVNENLAAVGGNPPIAFPEQEHLAHLQTHLDFIQHMVLPMGQMFVGALPNLLNHLKDHVAMWYVAEVYKQTSAAVQQPAEKLMDKDPDVSRLYDKLLAVVSARVAAGAPAVFAKLPPVIQAAQELLKQFQPPMPMDPTVAAVQTAQAETQRKAADDQQSAALDAQKLAAQREKTQTDAQLEAQRLEAEDRRAAEKLEAEKLLAMQDGISDISVEQLRADAAAARTGETNAVKLETNTDDNETAMRIAAAEISTGERVGLSTGTGVNPNP